MRRKIVITMMVFLTVLVIWEQSSFVIWREVGYEFIQAGEYNEYDARKLCWTTDREDMPFTYLEVAINQWQIDELARWGGFSYAGAFDFEKYCLLVSYGREVISLEYKNYRRFPGDMILRATYGDYMGERVFFYQLEKGRYTPTWMESEHYFMDGDKRIRIDII